MKISKMLKSVLAVFCVAALVLGMIPAVTIAVETAADPVTNNTVTKYTYSDAAGVASNTYTRAQWSRVAAADADQKVTDALKKVGDGVEYTFGLSLDIAGTPAYSDLNIQAFVPEIDALSGAGTSGYGVRLSIIRSASGAYSYQFYPRYAASNEGVGSTNFDVPGTTGWSGANSTGLQSKVAQTITSGNLKNKMDGNTGVINITLGFRTHSIEGDTVTVEYYVVIDDTYRSSVYTVVNAPTSYYKNGTELSSDTAYNALAGGGLVFYSSTIKLGTVTPTAAQYSATLRDAANVVKYNYSDAAGVSANTYARGQWSNVAAADADAKALAALQNVGDGMEYTFGLSLDWNADGTPYYSDMQFIAFAPTGKFGGGDTAGYGVRLMLYRTSALSYQFYPKYAASDDEVGKKDFSPTGTTGWSGPGKTGLQAKDVQTISDADLKAKMEGNNGVINITIGFRTHAIDANGTTVEYYVDFDGIHYSSVYTVINKAVSYYPNSDTTATSATAYNTISGGSLAYYSGGVKIGSATGANPTAAQYGATLSDLRQTTLVPDCDSNKGTMLIEGQEGSVVSDYTAKTVTVTPKTGYDVAGLMIGSQFVPAPAQDNGTYTFNIAPVPVDQERTTVKPMFVSTVDMLDYGTKESVTSTKSTQHVFTADEDPSNTNEAAHDTEFVMDVTFDEGQPKMIQIGAFLQESKQEGSSYYHSGTWNAYPYTPEYGFLVKMSYNVIYLCTNYGRIDGDVTKGAQLDTNYTGGTDFGYGWAKLLFATEDQLTVGDTVRLGLGEIRVDENNIIYYIRMNGKVVLNVPVDLSKVLNITDKGDDRKVVDSQNHVGNRLAFSSGDSAKVTVSSIHTPSDPDNDCTTAPVCSDCGHVLFDAVESHTYDNNHDTACNVTGCTAGNRDAIHDVSTDWTKDEESHWHTCSGCTEKFNDADHGGTDDSNCMTAVNCSVCGYELVAAKTAHSYDNDHDTVCNVSGCTAGNREPVHTAKTEWSSDENGHWHDCTGCDEKKFDEGQHSGTDDGDCKTAVNCVCGKEITAAKTAHSYDDDHDTACNVTGCTAGNRDAIHDVSTDWTKDEESHWHACSGCAERFDEAQHSGTDDGNCKTAVNCVCGKEITAAKTAHSYDNDHDTTCNVSGCTAGNRDAIHDVSTDWTKGEESHWHACSGCTEKFDEADHGGTDDGDCKTAVNCTVCGYELTAAKDAHTYTNNHDTKCNVTGCTAGNRDAIHDVSTEWSSDENGHWHACSGCLAKADEAKHSGTDDGDCTTAVKCTACGYEMTAAAAHKFTDAYDTTCDAEGCEHKRTAYTVTWIVGDKVVKTEQAAGEDLVYSGETPVKEADAEYTYTFKSWEKVVQADGSVTYKAIFISTKIDTDPIPDTGDFGMMIGFAAMLMSTSGLVVLLKRKEN